MNNGQRASFILAFAVVIPPLGATHAADVIFTLDASQSTASWSVVNTQFGAIVPQSPGSLSTSVRGHFLVKFDPSTSTPQTIQFLPNDGFYRLDSPHFAFPGYGGTATTAPANVSGRYAGGEVFYAIRDLSWDFASDPLLRTGGAYPADQTFFHVLSGELDGRASDGRSGVFSYAGGIGALNAGQWVLSEATAGSGDWSLSLVNGSYSYTSFEDDSSSLVTINVSALARAHFGAANIAVVSETDLHAQALGGASTVGGVSVEFGQPTGGGELSVQRVSSQTALSQAALAASELDDAFLSSTAPLSAEPQIWSVAFDGELDGHAATLVFHYDPSLLPAGLDPRTLGIWHFSAELNQWEFGGIVDPLAHTVTYQSDSFSPFVLGVAVPEPGSATLAALASAGLLLVARRCRGRMRHTRPGNGPNA